MNKFRRLAAALALVVLLPVAVVQAGPAADAIRDIEAALAALTERVDALEARPWPTVVPSPSPSATVAPTATPSPTPTPTPEPSPTPTASVTPSVPPSSPPSPTPTASPSPVPTASPSPTPTPTAPSVPSFGTRPASGALSYNGNCPAIIENKTFANLGSNVIAIKLENCNGVIIQNVDFLNVSEGVYAVNSSNIHLRDTRYKNITGPYERVGLNRGNLIQMNNVQGGSVLRNKGRCGDTEDIVSLYKTSNVLVEGNHFQGGDGTAGCLRWRSGSGSGIALGDRTGSNNVARGNKLLDVGQVGIFIAGGQNSVIEDNVIYGRPHTGSGQVGIYVWENPNDTSVTCSGHTVARNRVNFVKNTGVVSGFWNGGNCGSIEGLVPQTNNWNDSTVTPSSLQVVL